VAEDFSVEALEAHTNHPHRSLSTFSLSTFLLRQLKVWGDQREIQLSRH
jgi:hypothetical protein